MKKEQEQDSLKTNNFKTVHKKAKTFLKFNMVGIINTCVDALLFSIFVGLGFHYLLAQALGYFSGMINSFLWNKNWTFQYKKKMTRFKLLLFISINLCTLLLSFVLLHLTIELLDLPIFLGKLIAICVTVLLNFWGSRRFVFN